MEDGQKLFEPFPKLARLNRTIVITEKLDGTNAQIYIVRTLYPAELEPLAVQRDPIAGDLNLYAGSRSKLIWPGKNTDNAGFAGWAKANADELFKLGEGRHFGEWWGKGIQRGYGLDEKRFSLFNVGRWNVDNVPRCCGVVPTLYEGKFSQHSIDGAITDLKLYGSKAVPGWMDPEGIVVYHSAANICFKVTCKDDEKPKGQING